MKSLSIHTLILCLLLQTACSSTADTTSDIVDDTTTETSIFPEDLSIASPTGSNVITLVNSESAGVAMQASTAPSLSVVTAQETIATLLSTTDIAECAVELEIATQNSLLPPDCYGPQLLYDNHPEEDIADNGGFLPPGDLGLWLASDETTSSACAAAELNYQIELLEARVAMAQTGLASMVCVLNNSTDITTPASGESVDLTSALADVLNNDSMTVNNAILSLDDSSGFAEYSYELALTIADTESTERDITITMSHGLLDDEGQTFEGKMSYLFNDTMEGGGCAGDITQAGSVHYAKNENAEYTVRADSAGFCKANDEPFTDEGVLDPSYKYDGLTEGGWGNSYSVLIANYNPEDYTGSYSYSWQAGPNDSHSRVFNVSLSDGESGLAGDAYFGYGSEISSEDFDGTIGGFICDWAVAGSSHELTDYVQHQSLVLEGDVFVAETSEISYAPTSTCDYNPADDTDGFLFLYDIDANGEISSDEELTLSVEGITHSLLSIEDMDFTAPVAP